MEFEGRRSARIKDDGMTRPILKLGISRPVELSVVPFTVVLAIENLECNVGIICSCLPTLRALFPRVFRGGSRRSNGEGVRESWSAKLEYGHLQRSQNGQPPMPDLDLAVLGHAEHVELAAMHAKQDRLDATVDERYARHQRPASPTDSLRELVRKPDDAV